MSAEYGIFMPKTNSRLQQHIHQEQSILRQISNLEHLEWELNPALFHKIAEKFVKADIYLFNTTINKQLG